jgi:FMN phosphatase YigB (HAD superfamily)
VTSDELGVEKPDPAFFAAVLDRLGIDDPSRVLYVGDRVDNDVLPAVAAGMATCWVTRGPWGQLQELPEDVEPDLVLEGLGELPELLAAWHDGAMDGGPAATEGGEG